MKNVYILLTRSAGRGAKAIRFFTRYPYAHASIGLEEDMNTFYSFVFKGFIVEKIEHYNKKCDVPMKCMLYEIPVSDEKYLDLREKLRNFEGNKDVLRFSSLGMVLAIMRLPIWKKENHYFCSQFVAEMLKESGINRSIRPCRITQPRDFKYVDNARMVFKGNLLGMASMYVQN